MVNCQTNIKMLQFGPKKCFKIHIGKNNPNICPKNLIDTWVLQSDKETVVSVLELLDTESAQEILFEVTSEKYLGDIIMSNGSNILNIQERVKRGMGAVNQIRQLLDELFLGDYHYEAANVFRASLLLSTLLSNSESWYNLTDKEISCLEKVDEELLRKIFFAKKTTPIHILYLESGNIPIKFILKSRRLNFLFYILHENNDALIRNVFDAQRKSPLKGDWVNTVKEDLESLNIDKTFEDIEQMEKESFKTLVRERVRHTAFEHLKQTQASMSKGKEIVYKDLSLQSYLKPNSYLSIKDKAFIFSARTRMLELKCNFKTNQVNLTCRKCGNQDEDQKHLLECPELSDLSVVPNTERIPCYGDLFSNDVKMVSIIGKSLMYKYHVFKSTNVHSNTTSAATFNCVEMD